MGIKRGSITTSIVADGLVFNLDAANRACYPKTGINMFNTIDTSISGTFQDSGTSPLPQFDPSQGQGGVINFDGVDDFINCGNLSIIETTAFTISMWLNFTNIAENTVMFNSGLIHPNGIIYQKTNNKFYLAIGGVSVFSSIFSLSSGVWYNLVLTVNETTAKVYVNSSQHGSNLTVGSGRSGVGSNASIGKYNYGTNFEFTGDMGSTHIYNRALSSAEILHNYNALKGRFGLS